MFNIYIKIIIFILYFNFYDTSLHVNVRLSQNLNVTFE